VAIKFFGHYLFDEGLLTNEQLVEAIDYQAKCNLSLGKLAVREDYITAAEADKINDKQRSLDKRFGEVAIELGLLSDEQIESLLAIQKKEKIFFGEILLRKNFLDEQTLNKALEEFENTQKLEVIKLDEKVDALDKDGIIKTSIAILQKLYPRIVHDFIKLVEVDNQESSQLEGIVALQKMRGDMHLDFALHVEDNTAMAISSKFLKMEVTEVDEMVEDIMAEFVNVILGNIAVKLSEGNTKVDLTPPTLVTATQLAQESYHTFSFTTTQGNLNLYLKI